MAVENNKVDETFEMDGSQTEFSVTGMRVTDRSTIKAYTIDNTVADSPVKDTLVLDTDYTVLVVTENSFTVTVVDAEDANFELVVYRELSILQDSDYADYGKFPAETVEDDFDELTMIAQQLSSAASRSLKFDIDIDLDVISALLPTPSASLVLGWNATATALVNLTPNESTYLTKATQAEAEAGTEDTAYMTALKTAQGVAATTILGAKLGTLTGTTSGAGRFPRANTPLINSETVVALTPGATVATDASLGNVFTLLPVQSFTLSNPTNPVNGQKVIWRIEQDGTGSRVLTLGSSFRVSDDINSGDVVLSTVADTTDYIGAIYNSTDSKWDIIAFAINVEGN